MDRLRQFSYGIIPLTFSPSKGWKVLLILHRNSHSWGFPKGKLEENEQEKECAIRELFEETGLSIHRFLSESPFAEQYEFFHGGEKIHKTVLYFPALVSGSVVIQKEEVIQAQWMTLEMAVERLSYEEAKKICRKVEDMLKELPKEKI